MLKQPEGVHIPGERMESPQLDSEVELNFPVKKDPAGDKAADEPIDSEDTEEVEEE